MKHIVLFNVVSITYEFVVFKTSLKMSDISLFVRGGSVCTDGGGVTISLDIVSILWTDEGSPKAMISFGSSGL